MNDPVMCRHCGIPLERCEYHGPSAKPKPYFNFTCSNCGWGVHTNQAMPCPACGTRLELPNPHEDD